MMHCMMHRARLARLALLALAPLAACRPPAHTTLTPGPWLAAERAAQEAVAGERALRVESLPERSIGVLPFAVATTDTMLAPLAYGLADMLMTDLSLSARLRVVDRLRLDALLREIKLGQSGLVDPATAPRVGKLVGARYLVVGALTQSRGSRMDINAGLANTATGERRPPVSAGASLDDVIGAEKSLALRLLGELGVSLTPGERAALEQRPTWSVAALLAYSRAVRYEVEGQYAPAAREYENAVRLDPNFRRAEQRLRALRGGADLRRVSTAAAQRVNGASGSRIGGPTDPAFPLTVTIVITVTTLP